jgi:adenosine deaminase
MKFKDLPLYTHHEHLGGSVSPYLLWEIAKNRGINLPAKTYKEFIAMFNNDKTITFDEYVVDKFAMVHKTQTSAESVGKCFYAAGSKFYRESGAVGVEIRFNPAYRNGNGTYDLDEVIISACMNARRASLHYDIDLYVIIEGDRRQDMSLVEILAAKAVRYKSLGVVGFDMSGPYIGENVKYQISDYADIYSYLKKNGVGTTFHADENGKRYETAEILKHINPDRIGHGIKCLYDQDSVEELAKRDICLELCPTSNVTLGSVESWDGFGYTINKLMKSGVPISINTDGRELLGRSLRDEYQNLIDRGYITENDAIDIVNTAKEHMLVNKMKK